MLSKKISSFSRPFFFKFLFSFSSDPNTQNPSEDLPGDLSRPLQNYLVKPSENESSLNTRSIKSFGRRLNLSQVERESLDNVQSSFVLEKRKDILKDDFILVEAPLDLHGHSEHCGIGLNRILKDIVVRTQSLLGKRVIHYLGFNVFGKEIERDVVEGLFGLKGERGETLDQEEIGLKFMKMERKEQQSIIGQFVERKIVEQLTLFLRLGVNLPHVSFYTTFDFKYQLSVVEVFKELIGKSRFLSFFIHFQSRNGFRVLPPFALVLLEAVSASRGRS